MSLPKILDSNKNIDLFKKESLVIEKQLTCYRCICGSEFPIDKISINNGFYVCRSCYQGRKFNKNNIISRSSFDVNSINIKNKIAAKLKNSDVDTVKEFGEIHIKLKDKLVPLVLLEDCATSFLDPKENSIIVYYHEQEARKMSNVYADKKMIELSSFLKLSKEELKEFIEIHVKYLEDSKIKKIKEKISIFAKGSTDQDFEKEITKLFSSLRDKSKEIDVMLAFFKKNRNIPLGRKPVHLGGNNRSDIEFIDIFEYLNQLLNIITAKSADAKRYCVSHINERTITDKVRSNYGKDIIILTNSDKIDPAAWAYIWNSRKENGSWRYFIIDLDLLTLITYHLGLEELFNP